MDMFTHTYTKLMILKRKEKRNRQNWRQLEELCFEKKTLLKFAIQVNIYTHIYMVSLQVYENFLDIYIYMTITVYTHDLIFGNIYAVFEIVNELILPFIFYLNYAEIRFSFCHKTC